MSADSTCNIFNNEMIYVKSSCTSEQDLDPELERWEEKLPTLTLLTSNSKSEREH